MCLFFILLQVGVPTVKHFPQYVIVNTTTWHNFTRLCHARWLGGGGTHWDYNVDAHWNYPNCLLDYWSLAAWAYYHDCSTLAHSSTCSILLFAFVRYRARSDSYESNHARKVLLPILLSSSTVPTLVYLWTLCRTERRNPELLRKKQIHLKCLIASL